MRKTKVTEQQIEKLRLKIRELVDNTVWGGWEEFLNIWKREGKGETPYDKFSDIGMNGYNGFAFWRSVGYRDIYNDCGFCETMTANEFMSQIHSIWISVATRMILKDLTYDGDELAY